MSKKESKHGLLFRKYGILFAFCPFGPNSECQWGLCSRGITFKVEKSGPFYYGYWVDQTYSLTNFVWFLSIWTIFRMSMGSLNRSLILKVENTGPFYWQLWVELTSLELHCVGKCKDAAISNVKIFLKVSQVVPTGWTANLSTFAFNALNSWWMTQTDFFQLLNANSIQIEELMIASSIQNDLIDF